MLDKDLIDLILYSQFEEEDYTSGIGRVDTLYTIRNLFDREEYARYVIEKVLNAYLTVKESQSSR